MDKPKVVCLCGSTRFMDEFMDANQRETLAGHIVVSVGVWRTNAGFTAHAGEYFGESTKNMLDELHKRKIDISDEILVLDVGGYIGESTRSEIEYARKHNKRIRYLSQEATQHSSSSPKP
jgi:hypothetical protein